MIENMLGKNCWKIDGEVYHEKTKNVKIRNIWMEKGWDGKKGTAQHKQREKELSCKKQRLIIALSSSDRKKGGGRGVMMVLGEWGGWSFCLGKLYIGRKKKRR